MRTTNDEELHIVDIEYKNNKVKQICEDFGYAKKQYGEKVAKATAMLMVELIINSHIKQFVTESRLQKYRIHDLTGDKKGIKSLRIDCAYRMEIIVELETVCDGEVDKITIMEISKHYGD